MAKKAIKEEAKAEKLQQKQIQQQQKQLEKQQQQLQKQQQQQLPTSAPPAEPEKKSTGFFSRLKNRLKHGDQPTSEEVKRPTGQATSAAAAPTKDSEISVKEQQKQPGKEVIKQQAQPTTAATASKEAKKTAKELEQENITGIVLAVCHVC